MGYLVMAGITCIAIAFIVFVTIRFRTMEAVYFRDYGVRVSGNVVSVDKESAEHHADMKNKIYDIVVSFEYEGKKYEGHGEITEEEYNKNTDTIEFYCDSMMPERVIFYDPTDQAARGQRKNKIALMLLFAGLALFIVGRVLM